MFGAMKRRVLAMLRCLKDLERYKVSATDGNIGSVVDFFLDDEHWGSSLSGRRDRRLPQ